ncbi:MAG: Plasmid stabilization system protein [Chloroflexi bacterium ADurb.Bin325]|nr:MAG: Plasmid stabilization system protein [Chloroflexi bacterium ADurb.Bin325]
MAEGLPRWTVILERQPERLLRRLPRDLLQRLDAAILALGENPRPPGCKRLRGHDLYRVRVGDWRITYAIEDDRLIVLVVEVAPRGGAYRDL